MMTMKQLKNLDRNELLALMGLETRRTAADWVLPALGILGAGVLLGAGIGLLMAPKSGRELMDDLRLRLQGETDGIGSGTGYTPGTGFERTPHSA